VSPINPPINPINPKKGSISKQGIKYYFTSDVDNGV